LIKLCKSDRTENSKNSTAAELSRTQSQSGPSNQLESKLACGVGWLIFAYFLNINQ